MQKKTTIHPTSFLSRLLFYPNFSKQSTFVEWTVCFGSQVVLDSFLRSLFQRPNDPLQIIQPIVNRHEFAVVTYVNRELTVWKAMHANKHKNVTKFHSVRPLLVGPMTIKLSSRDERCYVCQAKCQTLVPAHERPKRD